RGAADHHAVAVLESPDAARDADVEEAETHRAVFFGPPHRIAEVAVAAVDEHVTGRSEAGELIHGVIGRVAGGHHRPEDARGLHLLHHVLDRARRHSAVLRGLLHRLGAAVPRDHAMLAPCEARDHVPAHATEAIETDFHRSLRSLLFYRPSAGVWSAFTARVD